jgi:hypothetical protein
MWVRGRPFQHALLDVLAFLLAPPPLRASDLADNAAPAAAAAPTPGAAPAPVTAPAPAGADRDPDIEADAATATRGPPASSLPTSPSCTRA